MRLAVPAVLMLALVALPSTGRAYVRSTTAGNPGEGLCLWWGTRHVTVVVNATSATPAPCADASAAEAAAADGLASWSAATRTGEVAPCTDFAVVVSGLTTDTALGYSPSGVNENLVVFRAGLCSDAAVVPADAPCQATPGACAAAYNCWEHDSAGSGTTAIALTTTTYNIHTGELLDADMELHGWNGAAGASATGSYLTCSAPPLPTCIAEAPADPAWPAGCISIDVASVATHEAGHLLGLSHTCHAYPAPYDADCGHTMDPFMPAGETSKRSLSQDDVDAVCSIYPAGRPTSTCLPTSPQGHGGGCNATGPDALLPGLLAAVLLFARRRGARNTP